jgi:hypothetical protein
MFTDFNLFLAMLTALSKNRDLGNMYKDENCEK